jgi:hypothetical protein
MIALLVDHNFNERIVDGMARRDPAIRLLHVRTIGLADADDPTLLEWAAAHDMVLLTHARKTVPPFAEQRVALGRAMPGVFFVPNDLAIGTAIEELLIAVHCFTPEECEGVVWYFPL